MYTSTNLRGFGHNSGSAPHSCAIGKNHSDSISFPFSEFPRCECRRLNEIYELSPREGGGVVLYSFTSLICSHFRSGVKRAFHGARFASTFGVYKSCFLLITSQQQPPRQIGGQTKNVPELPAPAKPQESERTLK